MNFQYQLGDETVTVSVERAGAAYTVTLNGQVFHVSATPKPGELVLSIEGSAPRSVYVASDGPRRWAALDSQPFVLTVPQAQIRSRRGKAGGHESLEAQMPGLVRKVLVGAGAAVERGEVLLVLEAMKMEIRISAPHAGQVERVLVQEGETVGRGQILIELADRPAVA